jgi:hypothetical protein
VTQEQAAVIAQEYFKREFGERPGVRLLDVFDPGEALMQEGGHSQRAIEHWAKYFLVSFGDPECPDMNRAIRIEKANGEAHYMIVD